MPTDKLNSKDFQLAMCQAVLFTPDEEVSAPKLIKTLLPKWMERFDADPVILPHEEGMPREIPRLILRSRTDAWRCEISSARINLLWQRPKVDVAIPTISSFYEGAVRFLSEYYELLECRVGRLAAVLRRYAPYQFPGLYLANHFCKESWLDKPFNRPENFELHTHKRFVLAEKFEVNSWVRNKTGTLSSEKEKEPIVLVEQDLNTPSEHAQERSFTGAEINDFFSAVVPEFDIILRMYYPEV
jgi:hypothetical protein